MSCTDDSTSYIGSITPPDGYEVVGYRRSYLTYLDGRVSGHFVDLGAHEAVVEDGGQIYHGPGPFSIGYLREPGSFLILRETKRYVQVRTGLYKQLTYLDPSRSLEIGDLVIVPLGCGNTDSFGTVVGLGRGDYYGECKSAIARLRREAL